MAANEEVDIGREIFKGLPGLFKKYKIPFFKSFIEEDYKKHSKMEINDMLLGFNEETLELDDFLDLRARLKAGGEAVALSKSNAKKLREKVLKVIEDNTSAPNNRGMHEAGEDKKEDADDVDDGFAPISKEDAALEKELFESRSLGVENRSIIAADNNKEHPTKFNPKLRGKFMRNFKHIKNEKGEEIPIKGDKKGGWIFRKIDKRMAYCAQSTCEVNARHISDLITFAYDNKLVVHLNTGTHGDAEGCHVAAPGKLKPSEYAHVKFALEDVQQAMKGKAACSLHWLSSLSPPIYPARAQLVINGWCYSDLKGKIQDGIFEPEQCAQKEISEDPESIKEHKSLPWAGGHKITDTSNTTITNTNNINAGHNANIKIEQNNNQGQFQIGSISAGVVLSGNGTVANLTF